MINKKKVAVFLACGILLSGCTISQKQEMTDFSSLPATEYNYKTMDNRADMSAYKLLKDKSHVYQYSDLETLMKNMNENYSGCVYFGFTSCPYCNQMVPILNHVAKEYNQTVTYVDTYDSRYDEDGNTLQEFSDAYLKLQKFLGDYLSDEDKTVYAPSVAFIKDGKVVKFQVGLDTDNDYDAHEKNMNQQQKEHLADIYRAGFEKICS